VPSSGRLPRRRGTAHARDPHRSMGTKATCISECSSSAMILALSRDDRDGAVCIRQHVREHDKRSALGHNGVYPAPRSRSRMPRSRGTAKRRVRVLDRDRGVGLNATRPSPGIGLARASPDGREDVTSQVKGERPPAGRAGKARVKQRRISGGRSPFTCDPRLDPRSRTEPPGDAWRSSEWSPQRSKWSDLKAHLFSNNSRVS
jgi:hypothetical protein